MISFITIKVNVKISLTGFLIFLLNNLLNMYYILYNKFVLFDRQVFTDLSVSSFEQIFLIEKI